MEYPFRLWAMARAPLYVRELGLKHGLRALADVVSAPDGDVREIRVPGLQQPLSFRGATTDRRAFEQVFISRQYAWGPVLRQAPRVIVDGGANVGYSAAFFARAFPEATIIAVEAAQSNMALLEHNTAALDNVHVVHAALWNRDEPLELEDATVDTWSFSVREAGDRGERSPDGPATSTVEGITLPTLMERFGLDFIDFLKLDIEGAEAVLFESGEQWLDRVGALAVELHEHKAPGCTSSFERAIEDRVVQRERRHENEFVQLRPR